MPVLPMIRWTLMLGLLALVGCASGASPGDGINGPTGRASDSRYISPLNVREVWKQDLQARSQKLVIGQLSYGSSARFDQHVHFDGYYDSNRDISSIGVYGNVTTKTDYGTVRNNGYYALWENNGRITNDFPYSPWQLVDLEITDQQY